MAVENPYTGAIVGEVDLAGPEDVRLAITAATEAVSGPLRAMTRHERASHLARLAHAIRQRAGELSKLIVAETGKPILDARREVSRAASVFELAAAEARTATLGDVLPMDLFAASDDRFGWTTRVPVGVIAALVPSNSPLNLGANKIAPALAMGNAIVVKPADQTPFTLLALAKLASEIGFPDGAFNVVVGGIDDVATPLIRDPRVRMVTATGGLAMGRAVVATSGVKKVTLELGSSSANIVCGDADLMQASRSLAISAFLSSGQACIAAQRIYVQRSVWTQFTSELIAASRELPIGDPSDEATKIGPMVSQAARDRVLDWIREALDGGARCLCGGSVRDKTIEPTILTHVSPGCHVADEEVFGPVAIVEPFEDIPDVIRQVNQNQYGLQAGIFTRDLTTALTLAREIDVGAVWINESSRYRQDNYPFGGRKNSGIGREGIHYAMEEMSELKFTGIRIGGPSGLLG